MGLALDIGLSALQTHQRALEVTSHNIANAATPGYTRQRTNLTTPTPLNTQPGQVGRGVKVDEIQRIQDNLIIERLRAVQSEKGRLEELSKVLEDVELTFNEPSESGLTNAINRLYASFQDLSNNPESNAIRSGTVEQMQTFVATLSSMAQQFEGQQQDINLTLDQKVADVNIIAEQIVEYNQSIRRQINVGNNPNDLMDARDNLLRELSTELNVDTRFFGDGAVQVSLGGRLLVGTDRNFALATQTNDNNNRIVVFADDSETAPIGGGKMHALLQVGNEILPQVNQRLDDIATTTMGTFNAIHSTGNNDSFQEQSFLSERVLAAELLTTNIDDEAHLYDAKTRSGIVNNQLPNFIHADGTILDRNLTINVLNNETGIAEKFVVRYEPGSQAFPASRSLQDLVDAINTGEGGGFSTHPPRGGGITNLSAQAVPTDGGFRLALAAAEGHSVDFSRALDLNPTVGQWTGEGMSVTRALPNDISPIPHLAGDRIQARVENIDDIAGTVTMSLWVHDPANGIRRAVNDEPMSTVTVPYGGTATFDVDNRSDPPFPTPFGLEFSATGNRYVVGEEFAIDFDSTGEMLANDGTVGDPTAVNTWTDGAASMVVKGRYSGEQSYDPSMPWSMEVVSGGIVGADMATPPPNGPPVVKFTYLTGPADAPVVENTLVTLDEHYPPGSPIMIADGVYAEFTDGTLFAHDPANGDGNKLDFIVDGQPDQAGILSAMGINSMFTGTNARDIAVATDLVANPSALLVGHTRASGDNGNLLQMFATRSEKVMTSENSTIDEFFQATLSSVAVRINQAEQLGENQNALEASLQNRRDEISGVSIDEEVGMMILHQQAYQAAARIISIERENIQTLIGILQ